MTEFGFCNDFRGGFARAMRMISNRSSDLDSELDSVRECHTEQYAAGVKAGFDHFNGHVNSGTERAHELGLVAAYVGYYGQTDYQHPIELPGHAPINKG